MKPCKAKLPDETLCPNFADEGQEYCPFHLAHKIAKPKKILAYAGMALGAFFTAIVAVVLKDKEEHE
jgi:hypothetical protein